MALLEPKEFEVATLKGDMRTYVLSKFPAIAGREIVAGYPLTAVPKLAEYKQNEEIMRKLMSYVAVDVGGNMLQLTTEALINNHVPDYETLVKIEFEMMRYNTSFFGKGEISTFFGGIAKKVLASISPTLTHFAAQLLVQAKQHSKN